ncbi:MAG: glutamate--tRNA ligase [Bacteroidota bacterium]|nr:glutamate--tRNA ligase [Bacteroidota bacterium]
MNKKIRTRFAPSPTGPLHMGGVRTALFNYLFAKQHGGDFLLRIEDTDQNRYVEGAEAYIIEALTWSGIKIDEGVSVDGPFAPYRQSERKELGVYQQYAEKLVSLGHAYYAFDTPEDLENMRNRLINAGAVAPQYNSESRESMSNSLTLSADEVSARLNSGQTYVIRLKVPSGEEIVFNDIIRGEVIVNSSQVDDKVLLKSDGMPTYHLAHIVDDVLMEITHAIRGEEWLPSAPAHILIYRYLGLEKEMPQYAHLPLLLKPDGNGKLSKRDGDRLGFPVFPLNWTDPVTGEVSSGYRERGYYPEAFVNMLALLGWNAGTEQEIFSMEELISQFSFEHVHKGGARFDPDKAKWFNEQYLRKQPDEQLAENLKSVVRKEYAYNDSDRRLSNKFLLHVIELLKERVQFENEILEKGRYLFETPTSYDQATLDKKWKPVYLTFFEALTSTLESNTDFTVAGLDAQIKTTAALHQLKAGEIMQLLRVFISGQGAGVDLLGMMELMGKEEVVLRMNNAMKMLKVK